MVHYVQLIRNMEFMAKKYIISVSFCHKLAFFGKTEG
jgi:hypothetical protein